MATRQRREFKSIGYELFMLLVSLLSIANSAIILLAALAPNPPGPGVQVVWLMEFTLTPVFLVDFLYRLLSDPSRRRYFFRRAGWADLIAIAPLLRIFRIFRIASVIRTLRSRRGEAIVAEVIETRATVTFLVTVFLVFVVVEAAGATIFAAESPDPAANITSAGDAVWWGLVTITTVGYGDYYPVTPLGRVIGVFLLFAGIALFSVLTGFIANLFLAPRRHHRLLGKRVDERALAIAEMRRLLAEQDDRSTLMHARLDEIERSIVSAATAEAEASDQAG